MNLVFSSALGWVVAVAIAIPIVAMFWWARRNAPVGDYEMDYSVGRRAQPPAEHVLGGLPPVVQGATDAPVPANPGALAPPTETVNPPASTVTLPAQAALPPEPPTPATTAPAAPAAVVITPEPRAAAPIVAPPPIAQTPAAVATPKVAPEPPATVVSPPAPVVPKAPTVAQKPVVQEPAPAPTVAKAPEPKPEPPAPPAVAKAPEPEPELEQPAAPEAAPEPGPVAVETPAPEPTPEPAAAASSEAADDFSRLYGIDAAASAALQSAGIVTYRQLSAANVDHLRELLAGIGQSGTDPATWPQQGRFAAGGKWKILDARFKK
jgi:DNA polymerase-3 subunit gamma/tau